MYLLCVCNANIYLLEWYQRAEWDYLDTAYRSFVCRTLVAMVLVVKQCGLCDAVCCVL